MDTERKEINVPLFCTKSFDMFCVLVYSCVMAIIKTISEELCLHGITSLCSYLVFGESKRVTFVRNRNYPVLTY